MQHAKLFGAGCLNIYELRKAKVLFNCYLQGETQEIKVESKMDVTVQITSDHELSLAEFLDGCAKVANETTSVVRSTLEDLVVTEEKNKTNIATNRSDLQNQNEVPEKHGKTPSFLLSNIKSEIPAN